MNFILSIVHSPDASPTSRVNAKAVSWSMTRISSFLYKIGVWLPSVGVVDQHIEGDNFRGELSERRRNWISQRPGRISRSLVFRSEIQPETPLDSLSNYQLINRLHELGVESNEGRLRRRDIQNGSKLRGEKLETQTIRSPAHCRSKLDDVLTRTGSGHRLAEEDTRFRRSPTEFVNEGLSHQSSNPDHVSSFGPGKACRAGKRS